MAGEPTTLIQDQNRMDRSRDYPPRGARRVRQLVFSLSVPPSLT